MRTSAHFESARPVTDPVLAADLVWHMAAGLLMPYIEHGVAGLFDPTDYVKAVLP